MEFFWQNLIVVAGDVTLWSPVIEATRAWNNLVVDDESKRRHIIESGGGRGVYMR